MTTDRKAARERRKEVLKALAGVMAGMFVAMTSLTIVATALPTMIKDLHGSQSAYTWVITGALLASTIGTVIAGKLADQFHKKTLLMWGFGIFIVGSLLSGFSWNTEILVVFRAIQGVGMGFQMALTGAVIASVISPRERGKYNGYMGAVMAVATVSGPLFGGFIVDLWGWRWCFWVAVPFTLIAMLIVHRKLEVPPAPKRKPKIDYLGSVLITVGVTLFMLWMTEASNEFSWDDWRLWILLVVSLIVLTIFVFWEKRAAEPLIPFEVLNTPITRLAVITSIMLGVSQNTVSIFMGQYFQLGRGCTPTVSGLGMLPISIGALVASTVAGYLVSSSGKWKPAVVTGMALLTGGSIMLIFIGDNTPYWYVAAGLALVGFGQGAAMQNLVLAVQNTVAYKDIGASTAAVTFARSMGGSIGLQALGAMFNRNLTHYVHDGAERLVDQGVDASSLQQLSHVEDLSVLKSDGPIGVMLQSAYANAIAIIFIATAVMAVVGLVAALFMRSTMLRDSIDLEPSEMDVSRGAAKAVSKDKKAGDGAVDGAGKAKKQKAAQKPQSQAKGFARITEKFRNRKAKREEEKRIAEEAAKLPRTAGREDLQPMELGEVWELGDHIRLQRVYLPGSDASTGDSPTSDSND